MPEALQRVDIKTKTLRCPMKFAYEASIRISDHTQQPMGHLAPDLFLSNFLS